MSAFPAPTRRWAAVVAVAAMTSLAATAAHAQAPAPPVGPVAPTPENWGPQQPPEELALTLRLVFSLAALSLVPAALMTMTSFTRMVIVLSFLRSALGTQQTPPNLVLIGLAAFLTIFVMEPVWVQVDEQALKPYMAGAMPYQEAVQAAAGPVREFMLGQTRERDLMLFFRLADLPRPQGPEDIPMRVLLPAFAISELKSAFQLGFVLYIPFIVLDLVVASALMSMGMLMLPPVTVSLPLKILMFVMIDGWHLIARSLVLSFH